MPDDHHCNHAASGDGPTDAHDEAETGIDTGMLAPGAWLALWGIRHRVGLMLRKLPGDERMRQAFAANGVADAAASLDSFVVILGAAAVRMIDVRCPACPRLSSDEALLLEALGDGARFGEMAALRQIVELLPPTAARIAACHAAIVGRMLRDVDLGWDAPDKALGRRIRLAVSSGLN